MSQPLLDRVEVCWFSIVSLAFFVSLPPLCLRLIAVASLLLRFTSFSCSRVFPVLFAVTDHPCRRLRRARKGRHCSAAPSAPSGQEGRPASCERRRDRECHSLYLQQ